MKKINYKVCRENVYVGLVCKTNKVFRQTDEHFVTSQSGLLDVSTATPYRRILFVPNEQKLSTDLLYQSPNYPVLNITDDESCLAINTDTVVIKDAYNLEKLLEYFGYDKELTIDNLIAIRKKFFTGEFAKNNCELFGWKESMPEDFIYYENGVKVTNPIKLKIRIAESKISRALGYRHFGSISENVLPREYWNALDSYGKVRLKNILIRNNSNTFKPNKEEGPIKKLKIF